MTPTPSPYSPEAAAAASGNRLIVDSAGAAARRSIPTIDVARAITKSMEEAEEPTAFRHARLRGLVDGNPPRNQAKLDSLGLGYEININFREAAAIINQKAAQAFELFQEVPTLAEFETVEVQDEAQVQPRARLESVVGEEFTVTLQNWSGFMPLMDFLRREADTVDVGVCAWRDPWDWRPVPISRGAFFPSPYAGVDVSTWNLAGLAATLDPEYLLDLLQDAGSEDAARSEGWDPVMIRRVLIDVFVGGVNQDTENGTDSGYSDVSCWEQLQMKIRNNDPSVMAQMFVPIKVRHIFVKEPKSQKISHLILPTAVCAGGDGFLCERYDQYDDMSQALFVLPYNFGNGYLRSVRGRAAEIEAHCDMSNLYLGRIFDAGMMSGTIMLKNLGDVSDPRKLQMVRAGMVTLLPRGCDAISASSYAPPLNNLIQVRELSAAIMRNNNGVSRPNSETYAENQPDRTAREIAEMANKEARADKANVAFDYLMLQQLYREIFRRLIGDDVQQDKSLPGAKEAQEFVRRCTARGVPRAWLKPGKLRLKIMQALGWGSQSVKLDVTSQLVGMRGLLDRAGYVNVVRDRVAALVGYRNVDRYLGTATRDSIEGQEHSIANLENNDLAEGQSATVGQDQNHRVHVLVHVEPLQQIVKAVAENIDQMDAAKAVGILNVVLPHVVAHLQTIAQDPALAGFVKQVEEVVKAGITARDQLARIVEKQQKEQARVQEQQAQELAQAQEVLAGRDTAIEARKAEGKIAIESAKQQSIMLDRAKKSDATIVLKQRHQDEMLRLANERQSTELVLRRQLAEQEAEIKRLKAGVA